MPIKYSVFQTVAFIPIVTTIFQETISWIIINWTEITTKARCTIVETVDKYFVYYVENPFFTVWPPTSVKNALENIYRAPNTDNFFISWFCVILVDFLLVHTLHNKFLSHLLNKYIDEFFLFFCRYISSIRVDSNYITNQGFYLTWIKEFLSRRIID